MISYSGLGLILLIYYHQHHCSHFIAATFDFTTVFTQAFEGLTLLYSFCGLYYHVGHIQYSNTACSFIVHNNCIVNEKSFVQLQFGDPPPEACKLVDESLVNLSCSQY